MYPTLNRQAGNSSCSTTSDVSHVEIGAAHDTSNSEKPQSCRSDELKKIKDQLMSRISSTLKVVPIVGMGGIGKTTLAKSIYEDIEISYHFHLRAWITISQQYKLTNVLLGLLSLMDSIPAKTSELENEDLEHELRKRLKGKRFLIVLDDVWTTETWNDFKRIIPDDYKGSCVLLTSRLMEVAEYAALDNTPHCMNFLSNEESWRLLHDQVFLGEPCPSKLVEIGKAIAKKCQGLPLAIVVVAGHLSKIDKNKDGWADVANSLDLVGSGNQGQILDILCLSYNYLPQRLKACFLYMGIFPKNSQIQAVKLIRMWRAMGFPHSEDEAEKCFEDLINRNLITVRKKKYDGTAKTCGMHDLLWDLCSREARKEGHSIFSQSNFVHSHFNVSTNDDGVTENVMDRISTYQYSGFSFDADFPYTSVCSCRDLRVLNIRYKYFSYIPKKITSLVGLRYLELSTSHIPKSVSTLCNLETLIIKCNSPCLLLPRKIWSLHRLRHLEVGTRISFRKSGAIVDDESSIPVLSNLQTLSTVMFSSCTTQVFSRIPNIKKLQVCNISGGNEEKLFNFLNNLLYMHRLENLYLYFRKQVSSLTQQIPWSDFLPQSLKKLTLSGSHLNWENMNTLAKLPNIEVLKLKRNAFDGYLYDQTVEGFPRLKVLRFQDLNLKHWIAETIHYPILRHLVLRRCFLLEEIPMSLGDITTLESIKLDQCSFSAAESAKTIKQEQQSMGNYDLQVRVYIPTKNGMEFKQ